MCQDVVCIGAMSKDGQAARNPDVLLMSRLAGGDERAMNELIHRFGPGLNRLVRRLNDWKGDSDDILQEVFLTAWRKAAAYSGSGSLEGWLRRLAVNRCHNHHRARATFQRMLSRAALQSNSVRAEGQAREEDAAAGLRIALKQLKAADRTVLVLYYLEELNGKQVAEALGVRIETVHVRLNRARQRLRKTLIERDDSDAKG